jgi:hypothetical protein
MTKRIAIVVGSIAAAAVLTVGLVVAGFGPVSRGGPETAEAAAQPAHGPVLAGTEPREPEVVYVKPARKRRTIVVERPAVTAVRPEAGRASARVRTVRVRNDHADREDREDREDRDDRDDREDREDHED